MERESDGTEKRRRQLVEWPTLLLILACYGLWLAIGLFLYPTSPLLALMLFGPVIALHSSLQHEILHGHPTRNRHVNELFVFLPIGVFYPYRRYKALHLKHHFDERLTDPYDDPESYYRSLSDWRSLPAILRILLGWNNTLAGRLTIGPALAVTGFIAHEIRLVGRDRRARLGWLLHLIGLALVALVVQRAFGIPFWLYTLTAAYFGHSVMSIRSYCEHQWSETPDGRTIIVEKSPLSLIFLNNNLHLIHHKLPTAAWYKLPALYTARKMEWQRMNGGYVFGNYWQIFRAFAFHRKEPVIHPGWRGETVSMHTETRMAHATVIHAGSAAPVPSKPPVE